MPIDDDRLASAERLITQKARKLTLRRGFAQSDLDDICQELRLHLHKRAERFDPAKATWDQFVSFILDKRICSLERYRLAKKRSPRREFYSLNENVRDFDGREVERHQVTPAPSKNAERLSDMQRDVADIGKALPTHLNRQLMDN